MNDDSQYLFAPYIPIGPPCHNPKCHGVLQDCASWEIGIFFHRCSLCGDETDHQTTANKTEEAMRTIQNIINTDKKVTHK